MANFFQHPDRRQRFLLPIDMMDRLPEDDIVHLMKPLRKELLRVSSS